MKEFIHLLYKQKGVWQVWVRLAVVTLLSPLILLSLLGDGAEELMRICVEALPDIPKQALRNNSRGG